MSICIGIILYLVILIDLLNDFKIKVLQARKGIFSKIKIEEVVLSEANKFPGLMIATQIMGFVITVAGCTLMLTFMLWGMFWAWIWTK